MNSMDFQPSNAAEDFDLPPPLGLRGLRGRFARSRRRREGNILSRQGCRLGRQDGKELVRSLGEPNSSITVPGGDTFDAISRLRVRDHVSRRYQGHCRKRRLERRLRFSGTVIAEAGVFLALARISAGRIRI